MDQLVDCIKFVWTALLFALAAACLLAYVILRIRAVSIRPHRAIPDLREFGFVRSAFLLYLVVGVVLYAGSKGSGGAEPPLRSAPGASAPAAVTVVPDDSAMPDFTNAISNLMITGFLNTGTSCLVRVSWPLGWTNILNGCGLGFFVCGDLASNDWTSVGAGMIDDAGADSLTVEIQHADLPGDGSRVFVTAVAALAPEVVRPFSAVTTNEVQLSVWSWNAVTLTVGPGTLPARALLRAAGSNDAGIPSPTFVGPFPQIAHGGVNAGWGNVFHLISHRKLTVSSSGDYRFFVAADDNATLTVGDILELGVTWADDAGRTASAVAHLDAGVEYDIIVRYENSGAWEYELRTGFEPVAPSPELVLSTDEVVFSPGLGLDLSSLAAFASVTGALDAAKSYTISIRLEGGLVGGAEDTLGGLATRAKAWPDGEHAWRDGESVSARFVLLEGDTELDSKTCVFRCEKVGPCDECGCSCGGMGSEFSDGCVRFAQPFGLSPRHPWIPRGVAVVSALCPDAALGTPAALRFDHPAMRRIVSLCGLNAEIEDGLGHVTRYRGGLPSGASAGAGGQLFRDDGGGVVEELPDGLRVFYAADGSVTALAGPFGDSVGVDELGLAVTLGADGSISSVESEADGRLDAFPTGSGAWRLVWSAPSGAPVKTFSFTLGESSFTAVETRDATHSFTNRWTYDAACGDWSLVLGADSTEGVRESKALAYDSTNRVWTVTRTVDDGAGTVLSRTEETVDRDGHVARVTRRRDALTGRTLASATLDATGRVASETDESGATTTYVRDAFGRVIREIASAAGVPTRTIETDYADSGRIPYGRRPVARRTCADGWQLLSETFAYGPYAERRTRTAGGVTRVTLTEYDGCGRETLRIDENGRATRTGFGEPSADGSWTETEDTGCIPDWAAAGPSASVDSSCACLFALVAGRSTREVRTRDARGDVIRAERFALVSDPSAPGGEEWRPLDWETHVYSASHKVVSSAYSDGTADSADWICAGPVFTRSREGVTVSNVYNAAKVLASSTRRGAFGEVTTAYVRDAAGRVIGETTTAVGCETGTVTRAYDSRGRVVRETDARGRVTETEYDDGALTTATAYADGGTRIETRNADGSTASVTGTAVTPEYHAYAVTTFNGVICDVHEIRYGRPDSPRFTRTFADGFGDVLREERGGVDGATLVTENTYDALGLLVGTAATAAPSVVYAYDGMSEAVAMTSSADGVTRTVSNLTANVVIDGEVWRETVTTRACSDGGIAPIVTTRRMRLSGLSLATNAVVVAVDARGNETRTLTALDPDTMSSRETILSSGVLNVETNWYNEGMVVSNSSSSAVVTATRRDALGRETARVDGRGNVTRTVYDTSGRVAATVDALTNATVYAYDAMGRVAAVTNALGEATEYAYDTRGNRISERGATYPVDYEYDVYGNRIAMTTYRDISLSRGDTTRWLCDEATGAVTNKVYADGLGPRYEYDALGRMTKRVWARGVETFYAYDGWGNLTNAAYSDGTPEVTLRFDAMGRQTRAIDAAGVTTFAYDAFGMVTNETVVGVAGTNVIERFYDSFGRDAGYALNGVRQSTLAYDPVTGRLVSMQIPSVQESNIHCSPSPSTFTWGYLPGSDLKSSLAYPNGLTANWTYGNRGELLEVNNASTSGTISKYTYTYDAAGRRVGVEKSGSAFLQSDSVDYGYNARSELTNATAAVDAAYRYGYDFDDIGNRRSSLERVTQSAEYAANNLNQYTAVDDFTPVYDEDGNETVVKTAIGTWQVTYNGENRPVRWELVSSNPNTPTSNTQTLLWMSYDRMGRRVTKNDQRFVYNGYLQIADDSGNTYIWDCTEPVATRPLVWLVLRSLGEGGQRGNSVAYYAHDGNKNVSEIVASDNEMAAHYEYAPFGALTVSRGTFAAANPWRFSSEFAEDDTATVYYNYRHYEPVTGRWLQRDPIGERFNSLLYGYSNRLDTDYLGMEELDLSYYADYAWYDISLWPPRIGSIVTDYDMWWDMLNAIGEIGRFDSRNDLWEKINDRVGECDCIRLLRITAHGASGNIDESHPDSTHVQIRLGSGDSNILREGYIREYGIEADEISEYFSGLPMKFCEKCTIRLISCHLGENRRLAERIRKRTGCKVDVYEGVLSPWFPPDSKPRNTYPPMWTPSIIGGFYYAY